MIETKGIPLRIIIDIDIDDDSENADVNDNTKIYSCLFVCFSCFVFARENV